MCVLHYPFSHRLCNNAETLLYAAFVFYFYTEQNNGGPLCDFR